MNEIIYLEPDDDITSVIGRIKEIAPSSVALVVPRGGNIAQSIVNLKLLKREIEKIDKTVSLVANDKISKNLASQVGISVYSTVSEAKMAKPTMAASGAAFAEGIKINRYNRDEEELNGAGLVDQEPKEAVSDEADIRKPVENEDKMAEKFHQDQPARQAPEPVKAERPIKHIGTHSNNIAEGSKFRAKNVSSRKKTIIIISAVALAVILSLSVVFLPKADASIILKTEDVKSDVAVSLDKNVVNVDAKTGTVPAILVSAEDELTKEFTATGTKNAGTKATGQVTFYNEDCYNPTKTIPAGTVLTASGKNFVTNSETSVQSAQCNTSGGITKVTIATSAKVAITASDAGEDYNLPASRFNVVSYSTAQKALTYAQSESALTGGTTKQVTVVSDTDIKKAQDETQAELNQNITTKISEKATKDNNKIIPSQIKVTNSSVESSKNAGDEASSFTLKIAAKGETLAYSESQLREVIEAKIDADLPTDQMLVNPDKTELNFDVKDANLDSGKYVLTVHFSGKKGKKYDTSVIRKKITNQKYGTALSEIENLDGVEKATLTIWPKFVPRTPVVNSRVNVKFDYSN